MTGLQLIKILVSSTYYKNLAHRIQQYLVTAIKNMYLISFRTKNMQE